MKRLVKYLGVTAAVVSAGCLCAMAADTPNIGAISKGGVYRISDIWKNVDSPVFPLPGVINAKAATRGARQSGPVALAPAKGGLAVTNLGASAIPGANAGSFLTPQERTTLSIQKTIRRLG